MCCCRSKLQEANAEKRRLQATIDTASQRRSRPLLLADSDSSSDDDTGAVACAKRTMGTFVQSERQLLRVELGEYKKQVAHSNRACGAFDASRACGAFGVCVRAVRACSAVRCVRAVCACARAHVCVRAMCVV